MWTIVPRAGIPIAIPWSWKGMIPGARPVKLGILADIHEHVEYLRSSLATFSDQGVDQVVGQFRKHHTYLFGVR